MSPLSFFRIALLLLLVISCDLGKKGQAPKGTFENLDKYQEYIAEVSHGIISVRSDVRVVFNEPVATWAKGDELDSNLLRVTPRTKGKVVVLDSRTIAFIPDDPLKQDTEYRFELSLSDIIEDLPKELGKMTFGVRTLQQQFNVYTDALQSYSKDRQYIDGQLRTADVMSLATAKQLVSVAYRGESVSVKFDEAVTQGTQFQFRIDSIPRYDENANLDIVWSGKKFDIAGQGKLQLNIPGKSNFSVLNVSVETAEEQTVSIHFSDPLKKGQNFKGLVFLEGSIDPKYKVEGNTLKVYPSQELKGTALLEVFQGIKSEDGYTLQTRYDQRVTFEQPKPQLRLLSNGTILPSSNNLKINFEAVNLKAVDVSVFKIYQSNILQFLQNNTIDGQYDLRRVARPIARKTISLQNSLARSNGKWSAHALDLSELISPEVGAMYRVELNYRPRYSSYTCTTSNFEQDEDEADDFDQEQDNSYWNGVEGYYTDYDYYGYNWNERENPCDRSYYYDKKVGMNLLATDMGVTIKKGLNNSYFVAVNDLLNTNPIAGAKVEFYNYQQQPIGHVVTNADGTSIFDAEQSAFFAVVEHNGQKNYVKLNDGNALSVSKFDVSGTEVQKGIKGFIFAERGVWRPGDSIFLSFMLNDNANPLPPKHPVKLELLDPYNKVVYRGISKNGQDNFFHFNPKTDENAPTGNWLAKVSVGGASFTKTLKIETIKPNRLKIKTAFDNEILQGTRPLTGSMEVKWLHGAVAKNLKADITAKFATTTTAFEKFPGYVFDDPTRGFPSEDQVVFDNKIDERGKANFAFSPQMTNKAPGMLNAAFITKVYENGGDFSTDVVTKPYSPYATYIGLNVPKGDQQRGMLLTDVKHRFELVSVDESGKAKAAKNLKVSIYKIAWRWWWDTAADNLSSYSTGQYREMVFEKTLQTGANGKATFDFELKYPDWGRYLVRVEDLAGGHATGKTIYIDWPGWAGKSRKGDPSAATMLVFSTDKDTYKVGETATVSFPSSAGGRALVTIENGSEVLESRWVATGEGETKLELPITDLYTPNVFISIASLQPHAHTKNDSPIRMYGVAGFAVENENTKLAPVITMPEVLRPEETITVEVSEKDKKAMTYSIAMVDEGLLDLTRFKTPDPWKTFYAKEALGVKTWDVYDDVIGAFGGKIDQVFAIGGDGDLAGAKNKKANRFEPMVVHLGPFRLKEGETMSHEIKIPKYVGSVRTMVVAGNSKEESYGQTEKTTPVRKPLMILASLPRKITPDEQVILPVTVFAMEGKVKNVNVKLSHDRAFTLVGEQTQTLLFDRPDEKMVYFRLNVSDFQGVGKVMVEATGGGETASFEIPIAVVNPNPVTSETTQLVLEPNASRTIDLQTFGVKGSNTAQVEFSTLPQMNFNGRLQYLVRYPHGCVEQLTSAVFPQLFLVDVFDVPAEKRKIIQDHVEMAIQRLGSYQKPGGGFAYWPGQQNVDDWGTTYAGHFLLEAERHGYVLPIGFKSSWIAHQQRMAKQWRSGRHADMAQAYRLYTLALSGNADVASMNRLRELTGLSDGAKYRLAASYALIGQVEVAKTVLSGAKLNVEIDKYDHQTYGSTDRNRAMVLETYVLLQDKAKARQVAETIAQNLSGKRYMSTQSTSYSLLAMAKFADLIGGKGIQTTLTLNGASQQVNTDKTLANRLLDIKEGPNKIMLKNQRASTVYVTILGSGVLPVGQEKALQHNLSAQLVFKGRNGSLLDPTSLSQGTDFVAELNLTNTTSNRLQNVALTEIFPSGWEIVNTRFTDFGSFAENQVTHTDLRDDRANFYFDMKPNETKTFRVLLNASFLGRYFLPGIQAETMYDNDYVVRTKGQWVEVVQ